MVMAYLDRVRELHKDFCLARDSATRLEILDRLVFVIEAHSRAWKLQNASPDLLSPTAGHSSLDGGTGSTKPQ